MTSAKLCIYKSIAWTIGSLFGQTLANIFVGFYETKLFSNANKPHIYHRYVDDTFFLNSCHPSLRFTFDKECSRSLRFLDALVEKSEAEFITGLQEADIYRSIFTMKLFSNIQEEN